MTRGQRGKEFRASALNCLASIDFEAEKGAKIGLLDPLTSPKNGPLYRLRKNFS